jgi:PEP-CTERM motif
MKPLLLCLLILTTHVPCLAETIRFDELGVSQLIDVDGLHSFGVLFTFSSPYQSFFNDAIGTSGTSTLLIDPVLTGPTTGTLTIEFDVPTANFGFDIALLSLSTIDDSSFGPNGGPAYTVMLSTGEVLFGGTSPQPDGLFSEGEFQYSGTPITGATISFFNGTDSGGMGVGMFALDNLTYTAPEPATGLLFGVALIGLGIRKRYAPSRSRL